MLSFTILPSALDFSRGLDVWTSQKQVGLFPSGGGIRGMLPEFSGWWHIWDFVGPSGNIIPLVTFWSTIPVSSHFYTVRVGLLFVSVYCEGRPAGLPGAAAFSHGYPASVLSCTCCGRGIASCQRTDFQLRYRCSQPNTSLKKSFMFTLYVSSPCLVLPTSGKTINKVEWSLDFWNTNAGESHDCLLSACHTFLRKWGESIRGEKSKILFFPTTSTK